MSSGKQTIKAAVERHARNDRNQDRRCRSDNGEKFRRSGHAIVRPHVRCRRACTTCQTSRTMTASSSSTVPRLRQQRDDHVVCRRNRRQIGEDDERHKRRQQRQSDGQRTKVRVSPRFAGAPASAVSAVAACSALIRPCRGSGSKAARSCPIRKGAIGSAPFMN